jgi:hypothetical protein
MDGSGAAPVSARDVGPPLRLWSQRGGSLVEVLASTLLISILAAMAYGFTRSALLCVRVQDAKAEVQEAAVLAADVLIRELRSAGFSPAAPCPGLLTAETERVEIGADLNGDGDIDDAHERIAYAYDTSARQITRATAGGSPQPFITGVPAGGLRFAYLDASGVAIAPGLTGLNAGDRSRIRAIAVQLQVELSNPQPGAPALTAAVSSTVCLRNS